MITVISWSTAFTLTMLMNAENKNCLYELNLLFSYNVNYSVKKCSTFTTFDKICYIVLIHVITKLMKIVQFKNLHIYQNIKLLNAHKSTI